jgi:hypothetical protein
VVSEENIKMYNDWINSWSFFLVCNI